MEWLIGFFIGAAVGLSLGFMFGRSKSDDNRKAGHVTCKYDDPTEFY